MNKNIITLILLVISIFSFGSVYAADFYTVYNPVFTTSDVPSSIYVAGAGCADASCTSINSNYIEVYNGDQFISCWNQYGQDHNVDNFLSCVNNAKIDGNIVDLSKTKTIVVKETTDNPFGSIKEFFTSGDMYLPKYNRITSYDCKYDVCVDTQMKDLVFEKKANAIAEIGQLNIKNLDNENYPVQIEVPVSLDETVCSAFRFTDPDIYRFYPPSGYSDYSANTLVELNITNNETGELLNHQAITIPIEADTCAGLAAFSWKPDSSLLNTKVKFNVETDVIDNEVSSSYKDYASDVETVYPQDLDNSAWVKLNDFTLSNVNDFTLNTSVAQITAGESLYALFKAGAWTGNDLDPIDFEVLVYFNDQVVSDKLEHTYGTDLSSYSIDLSSYIKDLAPGTYTVKIVAKPIGSYEGTAEPVEQEQKLQILAPDTYNANFHVKDNLNNNIDGASINLYLLKADDYYQDAQNYNLTQITSNGLAVFGNLIAGDYKYTVTKDNYTEVTNEIHIASNMDVYVTLFNNNSAPVIDLPENITKYYLDPIEINLKDYVYDYNDGFDNLKINYTVSSGINVNYNNGEFTITTVQPGIYYLKVQVTDPSGAYAYDTVKIDFINNQAPVIDTFDMIPNQGDAPLNSTVDLKVSDKENDDLTCTIDFRDGTKLVGACDSLNGKSHVFENPGTYYVKLTVNDGYNDDVIKYIPVYVYERITPLPKIDYFNLITDSYIVPTNITLNWKAESVDNNTISCSLYENGVESNVSCEGSKEIEINNSGVYKYSLVVEDSDGNVVSQSIEKEFIAPTQSLNSSKIVLGLDIPQTIVPGEDFNFGVIIGNDTTTDRIVKVKPIIECDGVENTLVNNDGYLDQYANSHTGAIGEYYFKTNTNDFKLDVPTNETCTFKVYLTDNYGTDATLTRAVVFNYPVEPTKVQSIRGTSVDVMNYMADVVDETYNTGYNTISFVLNNNNDTGKEISVSLSIPDLGIYQKDDVKLAPYDEKQVSLSFFIDKDVRAGMYPVRIGVNDGSEKQVRYSFIKIE
jgi:hypothetical protein